jgi:hypothetical protein
VAPRGVQQKRGRNAVGGNPRLRSGGPQRAANPDVASSISGEAEPLGDWAKAARGGKVLDRCTTALSRGSRGGTSRKEHAEHGRPHAERVATATRGTRPRAEAVRPGEESDGSIVPMNAVKAAGGKGPDSTMRPLQ